MPELGKYAGAVLWSWGATILLIALLIFVTWRASVKSRRAMEAAEARRKEKNV